MSHINHLTVGVAAVAGAVSAVHCVGMCSGIAGALTASLPKSIQASHAQLARYIVVYNVGRILSYGLAGLAVGLFSSVLFHFLDSHIIVWVTHGFATVVLLLIGLHLLGFWQRLSSMESYGRMIWRTLQPYSKRLLPVSTLRQAFLFGMIWGWLPCGLVYTMLMWTMASGGALQGAETMLSFGLGTFPTLLLAQGLSSWIFQGSTLKWIRSVTGVVMILLAIGALLVPDEHSVSMIMKQLH